MHIISAFNPLSRSDGNLPVIIFCYKDEKKLLRVTESYEETIERVINGFRIQPGLSVVLQTSNFTACRGSSVVIDSSAYPLLWSILEDVDVVTHTAENGSENEELEVPDLTEGMNETVKTTETPLSAGPSGDGLEDQIQDARTPSPSNTSSEDALGREVKTETNSEMPPKSDPLFQWDDDIQRHKEQLPQVQKTPTAPQKFKAAPSSSTPKARPVAVPEVKKEKQSGIDTSTSAKHGSHAVLDNITKKAARAANDDEARFDVVIIGPHEDTPTHFKLRGKNSVRKVLVAACKNFEVDPNWAYLEHSMELKVDGELQTHNFVCPPDDTIAMCGIKAGSKLFVKVDPPSEEEHADSASE